MSTNILSDEYELEAEFAAANGACQRTIARYRQEGLPFVEWNGRIWINVPGERKWLAGRVRRLNQKRVA